MFYLNLEMPDSYTNLAVNIAHVTFVLRPTLGSFCFGSWANSVKFFAH